VSRVGARFPAFCTANGKVLLAQLPPDELKGRLPKKLETPSQHRPVAREDLLRELDEVRRTGFGFDREEHQAGICATGVAIADIDGSAASISVPRPVARFHADADVVSAALLRVRDEVQIVMAADGSPGHDR
jgi:DNA-binding IclR family transcriptional regulator